MRKSFYLLTHILLLLPLLSSAQDYSGYTWYLGNQVIEFNRSNNTPTGSANSVTLTGPGAVVANPANGDILFYTDGVTVWDASNQPMPGSLLPPLEAGTDRNQPVVVAQVPGSTTQYYVITNSSPGGEIKYTIVDMTLAGNVSAQPLGDVDIANKNILVGALTNQSQAMIIVPRGTNGEFWLITHTEGSPTYNATLFTSTGPTSTTTSSGRGLIESAGNFTYNAETQQIAVSPSEVNRNIEILNFNLDTGEIIPGIELVNTYVTSLTTQGIYDTEWSPNGQYLYVSRSGEDSQPDLLQYDLTTIDPVTGIIIPESVLPEPNTVTASYGLQLGPDGAIYHLYESGGVILMAKITNPDNPAGSTTPGQTIDYVPFPGTFTVKQFPTFSASDPLTLDLEFFPTSGCMNVPIQFFPEVDPPADSLTWEVDGQPMSSEWSPIFTFDQAGPHTVSVTAYLGGVTQTTSRTVEITNFDTQIQVETEVTGCHEEFTEPRVKPPGWVPCGTGSTPCLTVTATTQGTPPTSIKWFGPDGEIVGNNTLTLTPPSPGFYYMVATGAGGCQAYAGVNVKEYDVQDPRANVWHFGNGAGIDFNPLFETPSGNMEDIPNTGMFAPEGSATISDRNGQVVIYTNGRDVWSRAGGSTPIATNIGGSITSTQSSIIMAVPGDETLYYIFTTQEITAGTFELRYTLFDLKLNGGTGGIVDPDNNSGTNPPSTVLFTRSTERVVAVGDWLIAHEYGNNTFRAYRITPTGISAPVFSQVGSDHSVTATSFGEGYMTYAGGRLGVAIPTEPGAGKVEVFDFDAGTGEITNPRTIAVAGGEPYGVNFSSDGDRMFVTIEGSNNILEYEYDGTTYNLVGVDGNVLNPPEAQPGAMQYGPDGRLYVAVTGENSLGTINVATVDGEHSSYVADATPPLTGTVTLGLPNFVQQVGNPIMEPSLTFTPACIDTDIVFTAVGKDQTIDVFNWEFSDGTIINDGGPTQTRSYPTAGTYWVKVTITNKCETNYFISQQDVIVAPLPPVPPMANGVPAVICTNAGVTLFGSLADDPNLDYLWNTGATDFSIQVTTPGTYSVTVTDITTLCTNTGTETVVPTLTVDLGPDLYLCQNTTHTLNVNNLIVGVTYAWFENGVPINVPNTQSSINVNTANAGIKTYRVEVNNSVTGCIISDEVTFNISAIPTFTAVPTNSATCGLPGSGSITLNITNPPAIPLTYQVLGNGGFSQSASNTVVPFNTVLTPLPADVYSVTVADQLSGCGTTQIISINTNNVDFDLAATTGCHPNLALQVSGVIGTGPFTYDIFDSRSASPVRSGTSAATSFTTVTLPAVDDTYTLRLTDALGCQTSNSILVQQNAPFQVTFDLSQLCTSNQLGAVINPIDATATFTWTAQTQAGTGNGIISASGTTATLAVGTWVVTATAQGAAACPGTGTTTLTIEDLLIADFTQSDACVNPVVLTATPTGPTLSQRWIRNNIVTNNFGPNLIIGPSDDNSLYQVTVLNSANGCSVTSPAKTVRVIEPFTVSITMPPFACEDTDFTVSVTPSRNDVTQFQWSINGATQPETGSTLISRTEGTYRVIGLLQGCASPPSEGSVVVSPKPTVNLGPLQRICPFPQAPVEQRTVELATQEGPFAAYEWFYVTDGSPSPLNSTDPVYVADIAGTYRVEVTDDIGCTNTADVEILEDCDPIVTGPNAFSPGSSLGANRAFNLFTYFITDEDFKIIIFNRWGEIIYQSDQRDFQWTGGYDTSSQLLPPGTYAYIVYYKSEYHPEDGLQEKRGGVVLVR